MAIVATRSGRVEGIERGGVHVFRGIPYASPPVGSLRWQAPVAEAAWDGVRDATRFSAQSAQTEFALTKMMGGTQPPFSEDSLYLNVWTPACDDARRPVMVWLHGGAFLWGGGDTSWYDGTKFATQGDVVLVTINYRLGPFGFLHLDDLFPAAFPGAGNAGVLDQVAALEWVRDCIAAFGGDPHNVTIFGESAGGASVGTLLGLPAARGLFAKAIAQSGAASWIATPERATDVTMKMLAGLGVQPGDVDALLAVSTADVLDAIPDWRAAGAGSLPFEPVVDGVALPRHPLEAIAAGSADGVHLLTGTNRHEMSMFQVADPRLAGIDDAGVSEIATQPLGALAAEVVANYRVRRPGGTAQALWLDLATDWVFRLPAIQLVEAQLTHGPCWMYRFTWETPAFGGILGSTHALEVPFVFDNADRAGLDVFVGDGPENAGLAEAMHRAWIAFARTGDPDHPGLPRWPAYDLDRRATMRFDTTCEVLEDPDGDDRRALVPVAVAARP